MRGDDGDALMRADGQQMLAVACDDQLGACRDCRRDDVIVIGIVDYDARHADRCDQRDQRHVLCDECRDARAQGGDASAEP